MYFDRSAGFIINNIRDYFILLMSSITKSKTNISRNLFHYLTGLVTNDCIGY